MIWRRSPRWVLIWVACQPDAPPKRQIHVIRYVARHNPLIIFLRGGFSGRFRGYGYGFGHGGVGVIGAILIVVVVLMVLGRL